MSQTVTDGRQLRPEVKAVERSRRRVLVVDDDQTLLGTLRRGLSMRGFDVELARDAPEALACMDSHPPDVVVLDIMMPGMDGLGLCRLVREKSTVPILMLTALDAVPDRVAGLQAGADDYLVKPFAFDELVARLEALLRRVQSHPGVDQVLSYRDLTLDRTAWSASRGGRPLSLTATEFRLLEYLVARPERLVTREDILSGVWEESCAVESNVVDVHVANLRQKLEAGGESRLIQTVRGAGYMLKEG